MGSFKKEVVKVAAVQAAPVAFDLAKSLEKLRTLTAEAASAGADLVVFPWENYMPAARMALYQKGVEIYLAPTADDLATWVATMQHVAKEGRCFVVSANSVYKVADFPPDYPPFTPEHHDRRPDGSPWGPDDILSHGGSCIVGPLGEFLAEPVWDKESIVYADLNMPAITEARMDFDPVGSYSRPDVL
ncbi:carbon-nitrogen hydrolase [Niveomyces insectorum RCEF 264]|uniref:Carbon-nitrogen hydrolase n=1 Tax=Niveomyces insectorum RCEF 264 TaxID=1081102 RepID=A0A167PUX0_9HYPO|nr:carbon-nitrogen hydrolase [Niveomyces insectorum RCEF 264]